MANFVTYATFDSLDFTMLMWFFQFNDSSIKTPRNVEVCLQKTTCTSYQAPYLVHLLNMLIYYDYEIYLCVYFTIIDTSYTL